MWAKIITITRTKDLNCFCLCAWNLFNTRVSQFESNYWNKWTFPRHSNLLRCTCINIHSAIFIVCFVDDSGRFSQIHAVLLCIKHTKWLLHIYVHDFNIKTRWSCFCGGKAYMFQQQLFSPCLKLMACTTQKLGYKNYGCSFLFFCQILVFIN